MNKADIRSLVVEFLAAKGKTGLALADGTDLLEAGLIDSLTFIEMIERIEQATGQEVDMLSVDPAKLLSIDGLAAYFQAH